MDKKPRSHKGLSGSTPLNMVLYGPEYLAKVEQLASLQLNIKEIAAQSKVPYRTFAKWMNDYPELIECIERGQAVAVANCAQVVLKKALGQPTGGDYLAALQYLNRFGGKWGLSAKIQHEVNISGGENSAPSRLSDEVKERIAVQYLKTLGYEIIPPAKLIDQKD